jgi:hypothetical protein
MRLIGIVGQAESGKDTAADIFVEDESFAKIALADPLKRFLLTVFEFDHNSVFGPSEFRGTQFPMPDFTAPEVRDDVTYEALNQFSTSRRILDWLDAFSKGRETVSPRDALISLGTDWGRKLGPNLFIDILANQIVALNDKSRIAYSKDKGAVVERYSSTYKGVVVPDVRFENELNFIKENNGILIKIERNTTLVKPFSGHASESDQKAFAPGLFDAIVVNDGNLSDFKAKIDLLVYQYV